MRLLTVLLLHCWEMYVCVWGARCGVCVCWESHTSGILLQYDTAAVFGRVKSFECMRVEQKGSQYLERIWVFSAFAWHYKASVCMISLLSSSSTPLWVCVWSKRLHKYSLVVQCFSVASPWVLLLGCSSPALWCFLVAPAPGTADSWAGVRRSAVPTEDQLPTMDNTLCALCACAVRCV